LDLDILPNHVPDGLSFDLDDTNGLHVVWFYGALEQGDRADWVRYTRSLDGGQTWSIPYTLDRYIPGSDHFLTNASPIMAVQRQTVHVIRYPQAIYHATWEHERWTTPEPVYLIAQEETDEGTGDRIHAHFTLPVVRAGNQLVLTFTDPPADANRRLFAMDRILEGIAPLATVPAPPPVATLTATPGQSVLPPTARPTWTATAPGQETAIAQPVQVISTPDTTLSLALVPAVLLLGATLGLRMWLRNRR
jgi:hypothetical protein